MTPASELELATVGAAIVQAFLDQIAPELTAPVAAHLVRALIARVGPELVRGEVDAYVEIARATADAIEDARFGTKR